MKEPLHITWPQDKGPLPQAELCPNCHEVGLPDAPDYDLGSLPHVSVRDGDRIIVHLHRPRETVTLCGRTFDELSLNNFQVKGEEQ